MQISLIQVPYMMGDERCGSSRGPGRFLQAGADQLLSSKGLQVSLESVDRGTPFRDSGSSSLAVCKGLVTVVRRATARGQFPLILGGGCDLAKGILAGFDHSHCGVVWVDAHGDFNTPETTVTGYLPGMSLAIITGHCFANYWAEIGDSSPIPETSILMLRVRELDPAERVRLTSSGINVVVWREGRPAKDVVSALQQLAKRVSEVYLHIDMDSLDPEVAPGVVDACVTGGLSLAQLQDAIRATFAYLTVRAASLVVYNPERDEDDKTLRAGLDLIGTIGESLAIE